MLFLKASNRHPLSHIESGNLINSEGFVHKKRCLDFFALLVGLEGTLYISQNGKYYTMGPKNFMLLFPGVTHEGYRPSEGICSYFWCHFRIPEDCLVMDEVVARQHLTDLEMSGMAKDFYFLPEHGSFSNTNQISLEFRQLIDLSLQNAYSSALVDYATSLVVMSLTQEYLLQQEEHVTMTRAFCGIQELQEYIRLHYKEDLSIPKLAEIFGYNANYLSTLYKKATGEPLVQFINKTRIAAAKTLLFDTKDSISAIASSVGFNDSKYFIRIFRKFTGVTPAIYRTAFFRKHINME